MEVLDISAELQLQLTDMTETQPCTPEQKNTLTACQLLDTVVRTRIHSDIE